MIILEILLFVLLGIFAVAACWLSSEIDKYDIEEKSIKNGRKNEE
jgi:hypothetical protein